MANSTCAGSLYEKLWNYRPLKIERYRKYRNTGIAKTLFLDVHRHCITLNLATQNPFFSITFLIHPVLVVRRNYVRTGLVGLTVPWPNRTAVWSGKLSCICNIYENCLPFVVFWRTECVPCPPPNVCTFLKVAAISKSQMLLLKKATFM